MSERNETPGDMLSRLGMDGDKWAREFIKNRPDPNDLDLMRAWFCNAIMAGWDTARNQYDQSLPTSSDADGVKKYLEGRYDWPENPEERVWPDFNFGHLQIEIENAYLAGSKANRESPSLPSTAKPEPFDEVDLRNLLEAANTMNECTAHPMSREYYARVNELINAAWALFPVQRDEPKHDAVSVTVTDEGLSGKGAKPCGGA